MSGLIFFLRASQADALRCAIGRLIAAYEKYRKRELREWKVNHA